MAKCKNCGKETAEGSYFCSKECMEAYKTKNHISEHSLIELENTLLDPTYMRGLSWRKAKLKAIHEARKLGKSDDWILRKLMLGGLTRLTAQKLMDDSKVIYGDAEKTE